MTFPNLSDPTQYPGTESYPILVKLPKFVPAGGILMCIETVNIDDFSALRVRHHGVLPVHPLRPQVQAARRPQGSHGEVRQQVGRHRRRERRGRSSSGRVVVAVGGGDPSALLPGAAELLLDILARWSTGMRPRNAAI